MRQVVGAASDSWASSLMAASHRCTAAQFHYTLSEKPHIQNDTITSEPSMGEGIGAGFEGRTCVHVCTGSLVRNRGSQQKEQKV